MSTLVAETIHEPFVTEEQLNRFLQLERSGLTSPLITQTIDKLFMFEIEEARASLQKLRADLAEFEAAYALSSTEFYQRYQNGLTDDRMDFVEWASLVQMANNLQQRLTLLTGDLES